MSLEFMKEILNNYPSGHEPYKKLILLRIADNAGNDDGLSWTGQKEMAKAAGISIRYVRTLLREMENDGLIYTAERFNKETGNRTSNYYIILFGTTFQKIENAIERMKELGTSTTGEHPRPWIPPDHRDPDRQDENDPDMRNDDDPDMQNDNDPDMRNNRDQVYPDRVVQVHPDQYGSAGTERVVQVDPDRVVPMNHNQNHHRTIILEPSGGSAMGPTNLEIAAAQGKDSLPTEPGCEIAGKEREAPAAAENPGVPPGGSTKSPTHSPTHGDTQSPTHRDEHNSAQKGAQNEQNVPQTVPANMSLAQLMAEMENINAVLLEQEEEEKTIQLPSREEPEYVKPYRRGTDKLRAETPFQERILRVTKRKYFDDKEQQDQVDEIDRRMKLPIRDPEVLPELYVAEKIEWVKTKNSGNAAPVGIGGIISAISNPDNLIKWRNIQAAKKARKGNGDR